MAAIVALLLSIYKLLARAIVKIILKRNERILNRDLQPYYSKFDVIKAIKFYVLPQYQNVSPNEDDEPGHGYISAVKQKLMPLFLDNVFKHETLNEKYFLILADSGMGKTSFLINLYVKYKNRQGPLYTPYSFDIVLMPLGSKGILNEIRKIASPQKTILMLDAFDEDVEALDRHEERMKEILDVVNSFRFVIITCRTQFFPSKTEEPELTKYISFGDSNKRYRFQKLYLSAFDDRDIQSYLRKKYGLSKRYEKAFEIVKQCPQLMVRPLLLSYIDDLINADYQFNFAHEIYEVLIEKWLIRESGKPGVVDKYKSEEVYRNLLYKFSRALAENLYLNRNERGGYFIPAGTTIPNAEGMQIADIEEDYSLSNTEKRSKSLLARDAEGRYKFSHKSILEYFLAEALLSNTKLLYAFDFDGMDVTKKFLSELIAKWTHELTINGTLQLMIHPRESLVTETVIQGLSPSMYIKFQKDNLHAFPYGIVTEYPTLQKIVLDYTNVFPYTESQESLLRLKNYFDILRYLDRSTFSENEFLCALTVIARMFTNSLFTNDMVDLTVLTEEIDKFYGSLSITSILKLKDNNDYISIINNIWQSYSVLSAPARKSDYIQNFKLFDTILPKEDIYPFRSRLLYVFNKLHDSETKEIQYLLSLMLLNRDSKIIGEYQFLKSIADFVRKISLLRRHIRICVKLFDKEYILGRY
jgi:hypothetical protein